MAGQKATDRFPIAWKNHTPQAPIFKLSTSFCRFPIGRRNGCQGLDLPPRNPKSRVDDCGVPAIWFSHKPQARLTSFAVSQEMPNPEFSRKKRARSPRQPSLPGLAETLAPAGSLLDLRVTFDQVKGFAEFLWSQHDSKQIVATGRVRCTGTDQLTWEIERDGQRESAITPTIATRFAPRWDAGSISFPPAGAPSPRFGSNQTRRGEPICKPEAPFGPGDPICDWIEVNIVGMANALRYQFSPLGKVISQIEAETGAEMERRYLRRLHRKDQKRAEEEARRQRNHRAPGAGTARA